MIAFGGWQFPDGEDHLIQHISKNNGHVVDGRLSYQYHKIQMALAHVQQFRVAVDVGAHVGLWTFHLASRFEQVVAFEPIPTHCACFIENVEAENVVLHACALGSAPGDVRMVQCAGNSGHTHVSNDGDVLTPMRTLDSFNLPVVDFLKIDCEGFEREVLLGAGETLERCRPTIIVEQKPGNGSRYGHGDRGALTLLEILGARIVAQKAGDFVLVWS